jgi:tetratricopeptide (TPR) repeat protein
MHEGVHMGLLVKLSALAVRQVLSTVGLGDAVDGVTSILQERFTSQSTRLSETLKRATSSAWNVLEFALAGDSLLQRLQRPDDQDFKEQVQRALRSIHLQQPENIGPDFPDRCLKELRGARKVGLLESGGLEPLELAREVGRFARFTSPNEILAAEWRAIEEMAADFPAGQYPHLIRLLKFRTRDGHSLLTAAARYYFRREVISDEPSFRESIFAGLGKVQDDLEANFQAHEVLLTQHHGRLKQCLDDVSEQIGVLGDSLRAQIGALSEQVADIAGAVKRLLEERQFHHRPVSFRDSLSFRGDQEREYIDQLVQRYRALPTEQRLRPELLNGIGKLQIINGDYEAAERDFRQLAGLATEPPIRAEAFFNTYQAALEKQDWANALEQLQEACKLDPSRYAPFPLDQYPPERILGAGGFGVAFLCRDVNLQRQVVVKALFLDNGDSNVDVLAEARLLAEFEHPGVVKLRHCGFVDQASRSRPFLVMDYFESTTLEDHVCKNGPLPPTEVLLIARQTAEALLAAHERKILHRDVKPANLLVRQESSGWQVKLIDFGLALQQGLTNTAGAGSGRSIASAGIAGTLEYAAPEQMGRLRDVRPGPPADIYSFAKTCCYALFGITQPLRKHWAQLPPFLVEVLERALAENPNERQPDFATVLNELKEHSTAARETGRDRILDHYQKRAWFRRG